MGRGKHCQEETPVARRSSEMHIHVHGSSAVKAAIYQPSSKELAVTYQGGSMYVYKGVEEETAENFKTAASKGRYLVENIKGKYPFTLVLKEHQDIDSSVISQLDYDSDSEDTLVTFTNGSRGIYKEVPWEVISVWEKAASKGKYFNAHIKGQYEYQHLDEA